MKEIINYTTQMKTKRNIHVLIQTKPPKHKLQLTEILRGKLKHSLTKSISSVSNPFKGNSIDRSSQPSQATLIPTYKIKMLVVVFLVKNVNLCQLHFI